MRSSSLSLAALGGCCCCGIAVIAIVVVPAAFGFAPPPPPPATRRRSPSTTTKTTTMSTTTTTKTRLFSTPEPIATEGDWSAYVDVDATGIIYYFNGITGESTWDPPTPTFPSVVVVAGSTATATSTTTTTAAATTTTTTTTTISKDERRAERQRRREERRGEGMASSSGTGIGGIGGGLFGLFGMGGGKKVEDATSTTSRQQQRQLSDLREIVSNNDDFLNDLDAVIAEAEEAIQIASRVESAPKKNGGGFFFGNLGFVGGNEAIEEVESLIYDAERRMEDALMSSTATGTKEKEEKGKKGMGMGMGRRAREVEETPPPTAVVEEENVWVEGLRSLFRNTFDAFIPPPLTTKTTSTTSTSTISTSTSTTSTPSTTSEKAKKKEVVVAAYETPEKERKARVSDSDFLDVIWGAETSARPTLNIKEMMKAFQVRSTEEEERSTGAAAATTEVGFRTLTLEAALEVRAHPEKVSWGGEDAGFFTGRTFGVFDGVSGAAKEKGKMLYSRCLADTMKKSVAGAGKSGIGGRGGGGGGIGLSVRQITDYLLESKKIADAGATGASTAVVASIGEDNVLRALNIGDSVCLVLRDGAVAARTREIVHYFDCPYQLGDDSPDRPADGTTLQAEIFSGDVIVAGSDGVFDNLSDADVCEIVSSFGQRVKSSAIARKIVDRSRAVSLDPSSVTPYSTVARGKAGYAAYKNGRGGKVDDISCLVVKAS